MVLLSTGGGMAAYSLDLRKRVLRACDRGASVVEVAATYEVSPAWVYRLLHRRRKTGSIEPCRQTKCRRRSLSAREDKWLVALITAQPDATRRTPARPADDGSIEHAVAGH